MGSGISSARSSHSSHTRSRHAKHRNHKKRQWRHVEGTAEPQDMQSASALSEYDLQLVMQFFSECETARTSANPLLPASSSVLLSGSPALATAERRRSLAALVRQYREQADTSGSLSFRSGTDAKESLNSFHNNVLTADSLLFEDYVKFFAHLQSEVAPATDPQDKATQPPPGRRNLTSDWSFNNFQYLR